MKGKGVIQGESMSVEAKHLAKRYNNGVWGARDITFRAEKSRITVLLGPNGAGKTTTIGMLSTLLKPTAGEAVIEGYSTLRDLWKVRNLIALCPQDIRVDSNWSPLDAVKGYLMIRGFSKEEVKERSERYLKLIDLWDIRKTPAIALSGGQRKRIAVAMVLASDAPVIFLDEPSSGLDVEARYIVWKSLRKEAEGGKTIILTTHDMKEAEILGDYVVMISKGKSIAHGTPESLKGKLPYTHKIVVKNSKKLPLKEHIDLGDRKIIYVKGREEAIELAERIEASSIGIEEVTLEDAYLYIVGGVANGEN